MITAFQYTDGMYITRTAEIVRKEMSQHKTRSTGTFDEVSMTETIPNSLLALALMIEHGLDIKSQIENRITDADIVIAIAQLLLYNFHSRQAKDTGSHQRHSSDREPPFAIYVGLILFAKTGSVILLICCFNMVFAFF
jgi:hypothetical protein